MSPRTESTLVGDAVLEELELSVSDAVGISASPIVGTDGDDLLVGTSDDDTIRGEEGNDQIYGLGGDDMLIGGLGDDLLDGGEGGDDLQGGAGDDTYVYTFGDGSDTIFDESGTDRIAFSEGNQGIAADRVFITRDGGDVVIAFADGGELRLVDHFSGHQIETVAIAGQGILNIQTGLTGTSAADLIIGDDTGEVLQGFDGEDALYGNGGGDLLDGGLGDDDLNGGAGNDNLAGGSGDDFLDGGPGDDLVDGGAGVDFAVYWTAGSGVTVDLSLSGAAQDTVGAGNDLLANVENLFGSFFDDVLFGDENGNEIDGALGNDTLYGRDGGDTLFGDDGDDSLNGDGGNDVLIAGDGDDQLSGGVGFDVLIGMAGNDTLAGGDEDDAIFGGSAPSGPMGRWPEMGVVGDDRVSGGGGIDTFHIFARDSGETTIEDFEVSDLVGDIPDVLALVGFGFADGQSVLNAAQQSGPDTIIELDDDQTVILLGVSLDELDNLPFRLIEPDDGGSGGFVWGDPHLTTLDGLGYDFQALGDYVLVETLPGDADPFQVQARFEALPGSDLVSITTRVAVEIAGSIVEIDASGTSALLVDGVATEIDPRLGFLDIDADGAADIVLDGNDYAIVLNDAGEQLQVAVNDGVLNVGVLLSDDFGGHAGSVRGLLGDGDGDLSDDFALRDGSPIPGSELSVTNGVPSLSFNFLYGRGAFAGSGFADSWRADPAGTGGDKDSLFSNTVTFPAGFPAAAIGLDDLPADVVEAARQAARDAGLDESNPVIFDAAVLDFALTGDDRFLQGALDLAAEPEAATEPDDPPPLPATYGVSAAATRVTEGDGGTQTVRFTVYRVGDTSGTAEVGYAVAGDVDADDLAPGTPLTGTVTFADSQETETVSIGVVGDPTNEGDEALVIEITSVSDGTALIAGATATTIIENDDGLPIAVDDAVSADENAPLSGNVLGPNPTDADSDPDGDPFEVVALIDRDGTRMAVNGGIVTLSSGALLTLNADGSFTYDASGAPGVADAFDALQPGQVGSDSFGYAISDGNGGESTATVSVTIQGANDAPIAADDDFVADEDATLTVDAAGGVLANDVDADGGALTVELVSGVSNGSLTLAADGSFAYTPAADFSGTDRFDYRVADGAGGFDTATVTITVAPANDPPEARDDRFSGPQGQQIQGDLLADNGSGPDVDPDGDELQVVAGTLSSAQGGSVVISATGAFTYIPPADFAGEDSFDYTLTDGNGGTDTGTVVLTLTSNDVVGTAGNDFLFGTRAGDGIAGLEGNDRLYGKDGNDVLDGGPGDDRLSGQRGDDTLDGGAGRDRLSGGRGDDLLTGGADDDHLSGDDGDDMLIGGDGNDLLLGGRGNDVLDGADGADYLWGGFGNDIIRAGAGDMVIGGVGADTVEITGSSDLRGESVVVKGFVLNRDLIRFDDVFDGDAGAAIDLANADAHLRSGAGGGTSSPSDITMLIDDGGGPFALVFQNGFSSVTTAFGLDRSDFDDGPVEIGTLSEVDASQDWILIG